MGGGGQKIIWGEGICPPLLTGMPECGGLRIQPFHKFLRGQGHYRNRLLNENLDQSIVLRGDAVVL